jgi:hypothetical protein
MTATGTGVAATASTLVSQVKFYASAALALARMTLAFNGVCAEGAFAYGGANYKGRFVGYLGEVDSQHGASSNILVEREEYNAGVAAGGGTEPLVFVPLGEYAGGLVGLAVRRELWRVRWNPRDISGECRSWCLLYVILEWPLQTLIVVGAVRAISLQTAILSMIGLASCYWGLTGKEFTNRGPGSVPRGRKIPTWWGRLLFCGIGMACLYLAFSHN